MSKSILQIIESCSVKKTAPKSTQSSGKKTILKISDHAKAIAHAKSSPQVKIHFIKHSELFCAKISSKKQQILEKRDHF